jgi:hypothetical protein
MEQRPSAAPRDMAVKNTLAKNEDDQATPNKIAGANAGLRVGFAEKPRVALSPWPGVARLKR